MSSAVIKTGGKQYLVSEGDKIKVEKLDKKEGESITFDDILLIEKKGKAKIGTPMIEKAKVKAKILEHGKRDKKIIFKYKPKTRQKKKKGHRQPFTKIEIEEIK